MSSTIFDPLALWGIEGMSQAEARALIANAHEMREVLRDAVAISTPATSKSPANRALYDRAVAIIARTEVQA